LVFHIFNADSLSQASCGSKNSPVSIPYQVRDRARGKLLIPLRQAQGRLFTKEGEGRGDFTLTLPSSPIKGEVMRTVGAKVKIVRGLAPCSKLSYTLDTLWWGIWVGLNIMYKKEKGLKTPTDNTKIWRYLDFSKFVSLLDKSALFFTRADKLGDPFEGSMPKLWGEPWPETDQDKERIPSKIFNNIREYRIFLTKCTIINCWHINKYESAAMWRLYLKNNEGIAIQSTFDRLKSCFIDEGFEILIGEVEYIDYESAWIPSYLDFYPYFYKRKSFEHDKELRAIIQTFYHNKDSSINYKKSRFDDGAYIKVDLDTLIENIFIAPTSPKWIFKLVKSTATKYGLNKPVLQSELENTPTF
jgi:hypothetical protein